MKNTALNPLNESFIQAYKATLVEKGSGVSHRNPTIIRNIIGNYEGSIQSWTKEDWLNALKTRCDNKFSENDGEVSREAINNYLSTSRQFLVLTTDSNPLENVTDKDIINLLGYEVTHKSAKKNRTRTDSESAPPVRRQEEDNSVNEKLIRGLLKAPLSSGTKKDVLRVLFDA